MTGIGDWYRLLEAEHVPSPRVLVNAAVVEENIDSAIRTVGGPARLRPHVKTHKSKTVVKLHRDRGIETFKCATTAEAEMLAAAGCGDVLVAYQTVGPALEELHALARRYRSTRFACLVDNLSTARAIDAACERNGAVLGVYLDLDVGMHRTGVEPGAAAEELYDFLDDARWLEARGLHAYDGHIHDGELSARSRHAAAARETALALASSTGAGEIVLGGTPSFPCHAAAWQPGITLSPGTYVYHDWGYACRYPDLPFYGAAVVFGRVIARRIGSFTVDIGSKAIAADPAQPRGTILNIPEAVAAGQSEEHWVFTVDEPPAVGTPVYVWPTHICPTIEHHDEVLIVTDGRVTGRWPVDARGRATSVN